MEDSTPVSASIWVANSDGSGSPTQLTFATPGARIELAGRYQLKRQSLQFAGTMFMDATISETQSGWKSLLLKAVDPLFKKQGGGSAIPFKISGTRKNPSFGLDYKRVFHRDEKP